MDPVLGGIVEERQEDFGVIDDLGDGLGPLRRVVGLERLDSSEGVVAVFGVAGSRPSLCVPRVGRTWVRR
jgi:hypothetical protein